MKKIILITLGMSLLLSGCNTVQGLGKDVQNAGEGIADGATTVKKKINEK